MRMASRMSEAVFVGSVAACLTISAFTSRKVSAQEAPSASPPVVDLHVDLAYAMRAHGKRLSDPRNETSPRRLQRGNVSLLVLPLFVNDAWAKTPGDVRAEYAATQQTLLEGLRAQEHPPMVLEPGAPAQEGRISTVMSFEGADGFVDDPEAIVPWIRQGVCFVGLVHSHTNGLAGGNMDPDRSRRTAGLTDRGKQLARVVYGNGAVVDVAHMTDASMADTAAIAKEFGAPLVATHAGMRALRAIERNLGDVQLQAIKDANGVVGIDLHSGHIGARAGVRATLDDLVRHIEHAVQIAGPEHVAIGSDLNGGIEQPSGADGAATWPRVARKLREKGWSEAQIEAVFHGNAERVIAWAREHGCGGATTP